MFKVSSYFHLHTKGNKQASSDNQQWNVHSQAKALRGIIHFPQQKFNLKMHNTWQIVLCHCRMVQIQKTVNFSIATHNYVNISGIREKCWKTATVTESAKWNFTQIRELNVSDSTLLRNCLSGIEIHKRDQQLGGHHYSIVLSIFDTLIKLYGSSLKLCSLCSWSGNPYKQNKNHIFTQIYTCHFITQFWGTVLKGIDANLLLTVGWS